MSERDDSLSSTSPEAPSPAVFQLPVSAPPSDDSEVTVTSNDIETPLPRPTKPEQLERSLDAEAYVRSTSRSTRSSSYLTFELCSLGLWDTAYAWYQNHESRADNTINEMTTEQLVGYMMKEQGFE